MLLLIPGPVRTHPEVRAAMAADVAPWDNDFRPVYAGIRERVRALAGGVEGEHATLPLQGCGHFILEAAVRTFVPPGGKLLLPLNGAYAERAARLAREAGREVVALPGRDTQPATADEVAAALERDAGIGHVLAVHSETGSGIVNDPETIGAAVRAAGRRMILDSVSAFGALPFSLAAHPECDAVVFTSGKCLEGMPGIGFSVARIDRVLASRGQRRLVVLRPPRRLHPRAPRRLGLLPLHAAGAVAARLRRRRWTCTSAKAANRRGWRATRRTRACSTTACWASASAPTWSGATRGR